jgi:HK97 family phage major capsid protein
LFSASVRLHFGRATTEAPMPKLNFTRDASFEAPAADERIPIVVSTEHPVDRDDFIEILSHRDPAHVDLKRAPLPLLTLHDTRRLPVGVVEDLRVDVKRRELRGFARFGKTPEALELLQAVRDKIVRNVSIGYQLLRELGRDGRSIRFAFQPYEASVVAVPADPGAAFFRSQGNITMSDTSAAPEGAPDRLSETAERSRVRKIIDTGSQYMKHGCRQEDIDRAVAEGWSLERFNERLLERMQHRSDSVSFNVGLNRSEVARYSFGRALAAAVTGDWSKAGLEREASRAMEARFGAPVGFYIPGEYWGRRDFNVGTATEAGNLVATDLRTDLYVDALRNALVASALGMRVLTGLTSSLALPRKSTASTLGTLTEIGSASETNPNIAQVTLAPKRIGAYVDASKQALIQSSMSIEGLLRDDLLQSAAVLIENMVFNGNGTAPQYTGIRNTTGIGTSTAGSNGAAPAWVHFTGLEAGCNNANAASGALAGYIVNSRTLQKCKETQRGTNMAFIVDGDASPPVNGLWRINGHRAGVTNNLPANLTKGTSTTVCSAALFSSDWSMAVLGLFGAPDITVDPYTLAATGQVRITLNHFADFCVRQPAAFAKIEDLLAG